MTGKNWGQIARSRAAIEDRRLLRQRRPRMTVEKLANECLAARDLQQGGLLSGPWVTVRSWLRWPGIERIRAARFMIVLELCNQTIPQLIRVSWTRCHFGGARPWLHCTYCDRRVARMFKGMGGYFCRACIGNPIYESQRRSKKARAYLKAYRLRSRLGGSRPVLDLVPKRPYGMKRKTYNRLCAQIERLERPLIGSRVIRRAPKWIRPLVY